MTSIRKIKKLRKKAIKNFAIVALPLYHRVGQFPLEILTKDNIKDNDKYKWNLMGNK